MVVAADPARLAVLQQRLDLRTVVGKAIQPSVLRVSGIADTDMLIARGPQDETKLVARKVAHDLFGCRRRSRVRSNELQDGHPLLDRKRFAVDKVTGLGSPMYNIFVRLATPTPCPSKPPTARPAPSWPCSWIA
jgi:hypothetical protein